MTMKAPEGFMLLARTGRAQWVAHIESGRVAQVSGDFIKAADSAEDVQRELNHVCAEMLA